MPSTMVYSGVAFTPMALLSRNIVQSVATAMACSSWTNSLKSCSSDALRCAVAKPSRISTVAWRAATSRRSMSRRAG